MERDYRDGVIIYLYRRRWKQHIRLRSAILAAVVRDGPVTKGGFNGF